MSYCTGWHWMNVAEVVWGRWGLGVEFSLGDWMPREWSVYIHVGPLLLGIGREQCHRPIGDEPCYYCNLPYPPEKER